jgi:protein SCO1/2
MYYPKRVPCLRVPLLAGILATILVVSLSACSPNNRSIPKPLQDILLEQPITVKQFELSTQYGTGFSAENLRSHWTLMFFGYTHCPDICPTTLTELAALATRIPGDEQPQIVFVSVDPRRDTQQHLKEYIAYFNEKFLALTGPADSINDLTKQLNIKYSLEPAIDDDYAVNHSSAVLLIDPQGRYIARFQAPHYAEKIQADLQQIKQYLTATSNT